MSPRFAILSSFPRLLSKARTFSQKRVVLKGLIFKVRCGYVRVYVSVCASAVPMEAEALDLLGLEFPAVVT